VIVVDTNLIAYFFIQGDHSALAEKVFQKEPRWAAPLLWRSEFRSVLMKCLNAEYFSLDLALEIISEAESLMKGREYLVKSGNVLQLALSSGCSAYDAEFVQLARDVDAPLVTVDSELLEKFPDTALSPDRFIER
jgi:predicted nucleic acid-binding protein